MTASIFGAAFDKLEQGIKFGITKRLWHRSRRYVSVMRGGVQDAEVILLGDTPGPGRPDTPGYHHTPFYSTKNSSLWLNRLLVEHDVPETSLLWFNTTLVDGTPLDPEIFRRQLHDRSKVICLGAAAKKWCDKVANYEGADVVFHPQAWKRFHSGEPYPLMEKLQQYLDL